LKLQQLKFLQEVVARGFNVSAAAKSLHTSQSGVSYQVRLLEDELGATIFLRQGKRLLGLTDVGQEIAIRTRELLVRVDELKLVVADFDQAVPGQLTVATTHVHARYALLPVIAQFSRKHPAVALRLIQTFPEEIFQLLRSDKADLGLTTEPPPNGFDAIPAYAMGRFLITPPRHPLLKLARPTLAAIARHALIVYDSRMNSGRTVMEALARHKLNPNVVLSAIDVDVIKAYVATGLGVAIIPSLAYEKKVDTGLRGVPVDHIFPPAMTSIVVREGKYVRRHARAFCDILFAARA